MTFAIVNLKDGIRRDMKPFLIDNDAFPALENAYLFRGRIQRRSCFSTIGTGTGRLRWDIGPTGASPFTYTLPDNPITAGIVQFYIGNVILTDPGGASPVTLLSTDPSYSGALDRTTGILSITIPAIGPTSVWYYPGLPVMGLRTLETGLINDESLMAFDTRYSYLFDIVTGEFEAANTFLTTGNIFTWEGASYNLFYTCNYYNALWATNNIAGYHAAVDADAPNEGDGIRWYDGTAAGWSNFNPKINGSPTYLLGALIILPYKDRLVCLNTYEGDNLGDSKNQPQRARWSQNGTPFYTNAPAASGTPDIDAWREDKIGKGGYLDAPTQEQIVGAEFIKDTLVVYFERSTWQLVYTGNEILPFVFQKINTELGCESTFSVVPFDKGIFAVGNYGIITTDSVNVVRIDQKIPDEVFNISNINNGVQRVVGIRDYNAQLVYFSFPYNDTVTYSLTFPNTVLVFNYVEGSWAEFDDSFTSFGYWQQQSDTTWQQLNRTWNSTGFAWNSQILQARYPDVIAGNQRGFVVVFSQKQNLTQNSVSLEISNFVGNIITCPDHNFSAGQYVLITQCTGFTAANGNIYRISSVTANTFTLDPAVNASGYTGGGMITHMPNFQITTKQFNPFYEEGSSVRVKYVDVYADRTDEGQISVGFFTSSNTDVADEADIMLTSPEPPTSFSANQDRIWHRIYTNTFGSFFQNTFTLNDAQMKDLEISTSAINIHGLIYYTSPAGRGPYDL